MLQTSAPEAWWLWLLRLTCVWWTRRDAPYSLSPSGLTLYYLRMTVIPIPPWEGKVPHPSVLVSSSQLFIPQLCIKYGGEAPYTADLFEIFVSKQIHVHACRDTCTRVHMSREARDCPNYLPFQWSRDCHTCAVHPPPPHHRYLPNKCKNFIIFFLKTQNSEKTFCFRSSPARRPPSPQAFR